MKKIVMLQGYLQGLYEAYDTFQTDYKRSHKRSKKHNKESVAEYYLRWRDRMRIEIRRIEALLLKLLPAPCRPCINTGIEMSDKR